MRLRYLLLAGCVLALANQGLAQGCERWNTRQFFKSATVREVVDCLEAGADVNAQVEGRTPLHWTVTHDADFRVIRILVEAGADVNARTGAGYTPLHFAPSEAYITPRLFPPPPPPPPQGYYADVVKLLVDAGADVNAQADNGETPLHWAAFAHHDKAAGVLILVDAGADVNARDEDGETPFYKALLGKNPASALVLVAAGTDVNATDERGRTLLHQVFFGSGTPSLTLIKALLAAGADVNFQDEDGLTPLYRAIAESNSLAIVEILLAAGAWVNIPGLSPLHFAAGTSDNPAVVAALLDAGADVAARDGDGKTPWDYAQDNEALRGTDIWWRLREGRFR